MKGSKHKAWATLDTFLISLKKTNTSVYAIPGNHEYIGKSAGMHRFKQRFPEEWLHGYCINIDSIAIVMLNSNFDKLTKNEISKQLGWYKAAVDSLDNDPRIKTIIVCTHHAPYSNSRIVGSSLPVQDLIVPVFEKSKKSKLFISGHSHNLEYFSGYNGKYFLVIGGGGGLAQPLIPMNKRIYEDQTRPQHGCRVAGGRDDLRSRLVSGQSIPPVSFRRARSWRVGTREADGSRLGGRVSQWVLGKGRSGWELVLVMRAPPLPGSILGVSSDRSGGPRERSFAG